MKPFALVSLLAALSATSATTVYPGTTGPASTPNSHIVSRPVSTPVQCVSVTPKPTPTTTTSVDLSGTQVQPPVYTAPPVNPETVKRAAVAAIAKQRKDKNLPALEWDDALASEAQGTSPDLCRYGYTPAANQVDQVDAATKGQNWVIDDQITRLLQREKAAALVDNAKVTKFGCYLGLCAAGTAIDHLQSVSLSCRFGPAEDVPTPSTPTTTAPTPSDTDFALPAYSEVPVTPEAVQSAVLKAFATRRGDQNLPALEWDDGLSGEAQYENPRVCSSNSWYKAPANQVFVVDPAYAGQTWDIDAQVARLIEKPATTNLVLDEKYTKIGCSLNLCAAGAPFEFRQSVSLQCAFGPKQDTPTTTTSALVPCGTCPQPDVLHVVPVTRDQIKAAIIPASDEQRKGGNLAVAAWDDGLANTAEQLAKRCGNGDGSNYIANSKIAEAKDSTDYNVAAEFKASLARNNGADKAPQKAGNVRIGCAVALCSAGIGNLVDHLQSVFLVCQYGEAGPTTTTSAQQPCGTCPQADVLTKPPGTREELRNAVVPVSDEQRRAANLAVAAWDDGLASTADAVAKKCQRDYDADSTNLIYHTKIASPSDENGYPFAAEFKGALERFNRTDDAPQKAGNVRFGCAVGICSAGTIIDHLQAVYLVCKYGEQGPTTTTSAQQPCGTCPQPDVLHTPPLTDQQVKDVILPLSDEQRKGANLPSLAWDDGLVAEAKKQSCHYGAEGQLIATVRIAKSELANNYNVAADWNDAISRNKGEDTPPQKASNTKIGCALTLCSAGAPVDHLQSVVFACSYS